MDDDCAQKLQRCQQYIDSLEEERKKIQVFHRELPLCLELVTQAIDACKQQLCGMGSNTECVNGQSECSGQTMSDVPVLEEFIPMKRVDDDGDGFEDEDEDGDEEEDDVEAFDKSKCVKSCEKLGKKSDWLRSVQLWNQTPDQPIKEDLPRKTLDVKKIGGAFHPFHREQGVVTAAAPITACAAAAASSSAETGSGGGGDCGGGGGGGGVARREEKEGQSQRKARRCWSPELHRRFLNALQQLGGSHAATPKQIRELMKVDGLTNDEVKSHLQKYRLHTRRPSPTIHNTTNNAQAPQFLVVGGIWVPPPEYQTTVKTSSSASGEETGGLFAPVAAPPPHFPKGSTAPRTQKQMRRSDSNSRGRDCRSDRSPATSNSSTHTSTASPAF